jgi:hypothetical protein
VPGSGQAIKPVNKNKKTPVKSKIKSRFSFEAASILFLNLI